MIYTQIDIDHAAGGNLRVLNAEEAWETIEDCAQRDKQWKNPTSTIPDQTIANLKTQLVKNEVVRVRIPKFMAWLDDEPIRDPNTMKDKVDNPSPQTTSQVLPSIEVYTPPVTRPEEVKETIGTLIEVEPLDHIKLGDLSLGTSTYDLFLSFKGFPNFDGPEPQPLLNSPSLDVSLGDVKGPEPPIKSHSPDSSRMKVVDYLTTQTPPLPHVANSHPKGVYSYCNPVLELKEVSPLGEELSLFDRPNEVEKGRILEAHRLEPILQQQLSQRMAPSHHDENFSSKTKSSFSQTMETASRLTRDAVTTTPAMGHHNPDVVIFDEKKLESS
ncbi:hypothetical protein Tco_0573532 [Tanacetum coccineum]